MSHNHYYWLDKNLVNWRVVGGRGEGTVETKHSTQITLSFLFSSSFCLFFLSSFSSAFFFFSSSSFFFFPFSNHNHQVDFFLSLMVRAGYLCVVIIHQTLTWTTGALSCTQMLMHGIAQGGVQTLKKSLHWKLTLGRKSFAAPGSRTYFSGVPARCCTQRATSPSPPSASPSSTWICPKLLIVDFLNFCLYILCMSLTTK